MREVLRGNSRKMISPTFFPHLLHALHNTVDVTKYNEQAKNFTINAIFELDLANCLD
jgi:hypothetical protein